VARRKGLTLKLVRRMRFTYERSIDMVNRGIIDVKSLITHRFPLERICDAFDLMGGYKDGIVKAIIKF